MGASEASYTAALAIRQLQDQLAAAYTDLACTQVKATIYPCTPGCMHASSLTPTPATPSAQLAVMLVTF